MGEDMKRGGGEGYDVFFSLRIGVALILGKGTAQLIPHSAPLSTVDPVLGKTD